MNKYIKSGIKISIVAALWVGSIYGTAVFVQEATAEQVGQVAFEAGFNQGAPMGYSYGYDIAAKECGLYALKDLDKDNK